MLIKNCKIFVGDKIDLVDILIKNGKIEKIEKNIKCKDERVIDAQENDVIPGIVDVHCHMREPGFNHKEDFITGSMSCAKGGVTTFLDMPNTNPLVVTKEVLEQKRELVKGKSYVDYGFHFGGSKCENSGEIEKVLNSTASTKIFLNASTGNMLIEEDETLDKLFKSSKIITVHAEGEAVKKAISLAKKYNKTLYLCHLSTKEEVELLKQAKNEGIKVFGEVTPHHLFLNVKDLEKNEQNKMLLRMKPELKSKEDNEALWKGLREGVIDTVGTDHAPHLLSEKLEKLTFGIPSVENSLEMMLRGVEQGKITLKRLIEIMSIAPCKIFKIKNKGEIKVGYDADLVIIDRNNKRKIGKSEIVTKSNWTPYREFESGGTIIYTILRGEIVYFNGKFFEKNGREIDYE